MDFTTKIIQQDYSNIQILLEIEPNLKSSLNQQKLQINTTLGNNSYYAMQCNDVTKPFLFEVLFLDISHLYSPYIRPLMFNPL